MAQARRSPQSIDNIVAKRPKPKKKSTSAIIKKPKSKPHVK